MFPFIMSSHCLTWYPGPSCIYFVNNSQSLTRHAMHRVDYLTDGIVLFINNLIFLCMAILIVAGVIHQEQWMNYGKKHHCQIRVWSKREMKTDNKLTGLIFIHSGKLKINYSEQFSKSCVIIINRINVKSYCQTNYYHYWIYYWLIDWLIILLT